MSSESSNAGSSGGFGKGWLFSVIGVAAIAGIALGVNIISRYIPAQIDFTENKFHSLTDGTKNILSKIDTPVEMTLFVSEGSELPPDLLGRVRDVETVLLQYEQKAPKGLLKFKKVNPAPDTDEAEQAALAGLQPEPMRTGDVYFGLSVSCLDKKSNVEGIHRIPDELFEYNVSRAISEVLQTKKKKVGIMSALPVQGSGGAPMMGGGSKPWVFYQQLKLQYDVKTVDISAEKIDDDIDALVLVHPSGITDQAQFAVDQFILKGKPVVALLDPMSLVGANQNRNPQMAMMGGGGPTSSSLPKLLSAWGLSFDSAQVVADATMKTQLQRGQDSFVFLTAGDKHINRDDVITKELTGLMFPMAGAFTGEPVSGLTRDILIHTSPQNELVNSMEAQGDASALQAKFKSSEREKALAIRLTGKFKSAFPDGKPKKEDKPEDKKDEKKEAPKDDTPALKEAEKSGLVFLIADSDFIYDNFWLDPRFGMAFNHNDAFVQNVVDQALGDTNLVQIRGRTANRRPFSKINEIEAAANEKIRLQADEWQKKVTDANAKLNELQAKKDPKARAFLSPEQQAEIKQLRKDSAEANAKVRALKKDARKEIDSKLATYKWVNILGSPVLVLLIGLAVVLIKRSRTAAH